MKPAFDNALVVADFFVGGIFALIGFGILVAVNDAPVTDRWSGYALGIPLIVMGLFVIFCDLLARRTRRGYLRTIGRVGGYSLMAILLVAALFIPNLH